MTLQSRARFVCYVLACIFTVYSARLVWLAVIRHDELSAVANANYRQKVELPAQRGVITDVHGELVATNEPLKDVIADASLIRKKDRQMVAEILAEHCEMDKDEVLKKIETERKYSVIKKKISEEAAGKIATRMESAKIKGVHFEQNFERIYPLNDMLSHVVGFYGFDDSKNAAGGIEGIERSMNDWLKGQEGWRYYLKDGRGRELVTTFRGEERAPRNGARVRLTVDLTLQQIVESELNDACALLKPKKASVIMMDPSTGAILAMANRPNFDPNEPGKVKPEQRFNHAVAGLYEPGSTMKTVTISGALHYKLITPETKIWCENGKWKYAGKFLSDHHPYGDLSVTEIAVKSSNIGAAKIAVQLGEERFYNVVRSFGFGSRTNISLPGEVSGILHPRHLWTPISITRVAIGHEIAATPLQVITATCAIANGGHLMMPQIIRDIRDDSGHVLADYQPQVVREVTTEKTALNMREMLTGVVAKTGTAIRARIPGYNVAGKTGTAQKIVDGQYSHSLHVTSFVGFFPAEAPKIACIVVFDETHLPSNEDVGGITAAPVFAKIGARAAKYLGLEPDPALMDDANIQQVATTKGGRNP